METSNFEEGEIIKRYGEYGDNLYFIVKGSVSILNKNSEIVAQLNEGQYFGEISLIYKIKSQSIVKANTMVECFTLSHQHFEDILSKFPKQKKQILKNAKIRIKNNKIRSSLQPILGSYFGVAISSFVESKFNFFSLFFKLFFCYFKLVFQEVEFSVDQTISEKKDLDESIYYVIEGVVEINTKDKKFLISEDKIFGNLLNKNTEKCKKIK